MRPQPHRTQLGKGLLLPAPFPSSPSCPAEAGQLGAWMRLGAAGSEPSLVPKLVPSPIPLGPTARGPPHSIICRGQG